MDEASIREPLDSVEHGESVDVTPEGRPVGELRPLLRPELSATSLLARWQQVPQLDPARVRTDVDAVLDPSL